MADKKTSGTSEERLSVNYDQIRELSDLAAEKGLAELTVTDGERSITLKTALAAAVAPAPVASSMVVAAPAPAVTAASESPAAVTAAADETIVTAPMVGTLYRAPSPGAPPFAEVGQRVEVGQTLCILEAMKLMNELECEVAGTITAILAEDGQPIEFGQPLFKIKKG